MSLASPSLDEFGGFSLRIGVEMRHASNDFSAGLFIARCVPEQTCAMATAKHTAAISSQNQLFKFKSINCSAGCK